LPLALKIRWFCLVEKYYLLEKDVRVFIDDLIFPEIASVNAIRKSFYCQEVCHFTTLTFPYYQFFLILLKNRRHLNLNILVSTNLHFPAMSFICDVYGSLGSHF
jgi:hypothetical protein